MNTKPANNPPPISKEQAIAWLDEQIEIMDGHLLANERLTRSTRDHDRFIQIRQLLSQS